MARYAVEIPNDVLTELEKRDTKLESITDEMLEAGGKVVYARAEGNISKSFKNPAPIRSGLRLTRVYKNSDEGKSIKVGFYGYYKARKTKKYPGGVPIPLIASAREYGTSSGEAAKPFFRKSFNRAAINAAMQAVHDKYIKE